MTDQTTPQATSSDLVASRTLLTELWALHQLARTALAGTGKDSWLDRASWAIIEFNKAHPEFSTGAAYKALDRTRNRW